MTIAEIARYEKVGKSTMECWFNRLKKVEKVRNKLEEFRRKGKNKNKKLYPYKDGKMYFADEIQKMHPYLSIYMVRRRYRSERPGDWDAIFAPNGTIGGAKQNNRIDKKHLKGLGPRRSIESIKGPSALEKQLWG